MSSNSVIINDMPVNTSSINASSAYLNIRLYPQSGSTSSAEFKLNGRSVMVDNQTPAKWLDQEDHGFQRLVITISN